MTERLSIPLRSEPNAAVTAATIVALVGALTIGGFFFFQYVVGLAPCPLCLEQRDAFYVAVPLAVLLLLGHGNGASPKVLALGFLVIAGVMLWNTGLSAYHAGVEWKWWPGPLECSGPINKFGPAKDLLNNLGSISLIRCDEVSWRFLGLSLAGWDVVVSLGLAFTALWGAKGTLAPRKS
jgi:disulfide bond formation protein DsbB